MTEASTLQAILVSLLFNHLYLLTTSELCQYKRPLDSYAYPYQSKWNRTKFTKNITTLQKYSKLVQFFGKKAHRVCSVAKSATKMAPFSSHHVTDEAMYQSETPLNWRARTSLSIKVPIVRIDPLDWKLHGNNQSMSNSVFSVCSYILVLRLRLIKTSKVSNWLTFSRPLVWWCYGMECFQVSNCVCVMWFWFMAHSFPAKRVAFFHVASQSCREKEAVSYSKTERAASFLISWDALWLTQKSYASMRQHCKDAVQWHCK